ncbi:ABC transporter permease [Anaerorhabdus furcosa]|uniref:Sodium transport system permease protein n=1 Tax=Anaerorhabdus furcosa TaxID=118967 RepID=A0A1T4K4Q0_9FIRM|nr:ABC transporter permease [Anaerorhabdus furcosa]SJZ37389.1 sodium transport system permease protein [Anaerorhabdus furcosa]
MHNIVTIIKKELARFFKDKKLVFTTVLFPGLMIYLLYSFMGSGFLNKMEGDSTYIPKIVVNEIPSEIEPLFQETKYDFRGFTENELDAVLTQIENKEIDVAIIFPENFEEDIQTHSQIPNVEIYYNSTKSDSSSAYRALIAVLSQYENTLSNVFDVNVDQSITYDLASEKDLTGEIFSMMLPMLLMIFIFSGCMGIAPESIAGEKERGTIATLLVTPMKRSELAIGKIISLSIISLLAGLSSFLGTILSLPKLYGGQMDGVNAMAYSMMDYVMLLVIILSSILIIISLISIISAYSKSVKEATTAIMPLMIVVMLIGVSSMMISDKGPSLITALIPLYNNVACMNGIFGFTLNPIYFAITLVANLIYTFIFVFVLAKMFNSEKCMF